MTATRSPVKSTGSCGQRPVWNQRPWKPSRPAISGLIAAERAPIAMMQNRAETRSPRSVSTSQRLAASS